MLFLLSTTLALLLGLGPRIQPTSLVNVTKVVLSPLKWLICPAPPGDSQQDDHVISLEIARCNWCSFGLALVAVAGRTRD